MRRLLVVFALTFTACGSDTPAPECTGSSCACPANSSCDIGDSGCSGDSCTLACTMSNTCTGSCGDSCSIDCSGESDCDVTVGSSSSVSCGAGSTCTVRCTGSCSLSCATGATCMLQCSGESQPKTVEQGGSCG